MLNEKHRMWNQSYVQYNWGYTEWYFHMGKDQNNYGKSDGYLLEDRVTNISASIFFLWQLCKVIWTKPNGHLSLGAMYFVRISLWQEKQTKIPTGIF